MELSKFGIVEIDIHKLGFKPTPQEIEQAREIVRKLFREWLEIKDEKERLATPIPANRINRRAKKLIHSKRIFFIVQAVVQKMTYDEETGQ